MSPEDASFSAYLREITSERCVQFCAERAGLTPDSVRRRFADYAGEVRVGVALLNSIGLSGRRVLEVGAGLGFLSIWLRRQGAAVVMLEPGAGGFSENSRLLTAVRHFLNADDVPVIEETAQNLDTTRHGQFDVIFSVNVLEHIPALEAALDAMLTVLAPGGIMRHTCPNYAVPYEPHYAMPLVPFAARATALLAPWLKREELWQSINFITYGRISRFCAARGLDCVFDRGTLAQAFARLEEDPAFRARRGRMAPLAHRLLRGTGLLILIALLPPRWATPMAFGCWRRDNPPNHARPPRD